MFKAILCLVSIGFIAGSAIPAHAEGALREKIKEAMQARMAKK
jgi:hypothetical protein